MGQPGAGDAASRRGEHIASTEGTGGTETSHVPRGEESIPGVVANETGAAETGHLSKPAGVGCAGLDGPLGPTAVGPASEKPEH
jgi:hypothetical protein